MENRMKVLLGLACLVILLLSLSAAGVLEEPGAKWKSPHRWKIRPGTTEWARLPGLAEKVAASDISKPEAKSMNTRDLVATVMEYPLLGNVDAFDNPKAGFTQLHENFYGFKELLTRVDAGPNLASWMEDNFNLKTYEISILDRLLLDSRFLSIFNTDCLTRICNIIFKRIRVERKTSPKTTLTEVNLCRVVVKMLVEKDLVLRHGKSTLQKTTLPEDWELLNKGFPYWGANTVRVIAEHAADLE